MMNRDLCADPEAFFQHLLLKAYSYSLQDPKQNSVPKIYVFCNFNILHWFMYKLPYFNCAGYNTLHKSHSPEMNSVLLLVHVCISSLILIRQSIDLLLDFTVLTLVALTLCICETLYQLFGEFWLNFASIFNLK